MNRDETIFNLREAIQEQIKQVFEPRIAALELHYDQKHARARADQIAGVETRINTLEKIQARAKAAKEFPNLVLAKAKASKETDFNKMRSAAFDKANGGKPRSIFCVVKIARPPRYYFPNQTDHSFKTK